MKAKRPRISSGEKPFNPQRFTKVASSGAIVRNGNVFFNFNAKKLHLYFLHKKERELRHEIHDTFREAQFKR